MNVKKYTKIVRKALPLRTCGAVIVAAGSASRMGGVDKIMAPLGGEPLIVHSVRTFQNCDAIREIVIVTRSDLIVPIMSLCHSFSKVKAVLVGGNTRTESVQIGLGALSSKMAMAAIHDGARPLVSWELIDRVVRAAHTYHAAAPAIAVKDTIKVVRGGVVMATPDRKALRAVQTPQVFDTDLLKGALTFAKKEGVELTDDCSAVEYLGMSVRIVEGEERNLKVTTPMDLKIAQMLWEETQ